MPKHASALGHHAVGGREGTLEQLRGVATRIILTHVDNSDPILNPDSAASRSVRDADAEVAYDGMELRV